MSQGVVIWSHNVSELRTAFSDLADAFKVFQQKLYLTSQMLIVLAALCSLFLAACLQRGGGGVMRFSRLLSIPGDTGRDKEESCILPHAAGQLL